MKTRAEVIALVEKLLRMGDSTRGATINEVEQAMAKARKLMADHSLGLSDVSVDGEQTSEPVDPLAFGEDHVVRGGRIWEIELAGACGYLTGTKLIQAWRLVMGKQKKVFIFMGEVTDVAVAKAMYGALQATMNEMMRQALGASTSDNRATIQRSYREGWTIEVRNRAAQQAKAQPEGFTAAQSTALVVINKNKADGIALYVKTNYPRLVKTKTQRSRGDWSAFEQGRADGRRANLGSRRMLS